MKQFQVTPIGRVRVDSAGMSIHIEPEFVPALEAIGGFSHLSVIWWFSESDNEAARGLRQVERPYKHAPERMGVFATRSPERPNPLGLTVVPVIRTDTLQGVIQVGYIDAYDGTPVLDIKPYTPSVDRVESPVVPAWCGHWPTSLEASEDFDWSGVFNF